MKHSILLNRFTLKALLFIIFLLIINGCNINNKENEDYGRLNTDDPELNIDKQLDYILEGEGAKKLELEGLKLINYNIKKKKIPAESAASELLTEESIIPVYNVNPETINNFHLAYIYEIKKSSTSNVEQIYSDKKRNILTPFFGADLNIVEFYWDYNGKRFKTRGFVCKEVQQFAYDDILSNIRYISIIPASETDNDSSAIESATKNSSPESITYTFKTPIYTRSNYWGKKVASAQCRLDVLGKTNFVKSIESYSNRNEFDSDPGYSADAKINIKSFVTGSEGHCEFGYAVMVGDNGNLTIGWNGSSYTIPNGSFGESGGKYIIPSMLK